MTEHNKTICVPDIGGASKVTVIEILVKVGDMIHVDTPIITLESEKASMEIPSTDEGKVVSVDVAIGGKVSEGDVILHIATSKHTEAPAPTPVSTTQAPVKTPPVATPAEPLATTASSTTDSKPQTPVMETQEGSFAAGPGTRRLARELNIDLAQVQHTYRKTRIAKEDVLQFLRQSLGGGAGAMPSLAPTIDFSAFGEIEVKPLNKIKRLTAEAMTRSWTTVPHVTQFDEADITDLEAYRLAKAPAAEKQGVRLTLLAFITKVVAHALRKFPQFNTSLDTQTMSLIHKHYVNIGIAVETEQGLVVPVIRDVPHLTISEIARKMSELSDKARNNKMGLQDMSGGTFTVSSLGGIGGTAFTPIVNTPEVAILGVSRSAKRFREHNGTGAFRLVLPLSLSYDHRVIDGAEGARFLRFIAASLEDMRELWL
jgi:pyruvate dehydrogenase E2 component (dihydrolipoamide acetyltransferase)